MHLLDLKYSKPIEREFESWIVHGIEHYFKEIAGEVAIWSVSPMSEVHWPADEHLLVGRKLIGLQFKGVSYQPLKNRGHNFGRLNWQFGKPKGQIDLVRKFPEIYYCLPTFVNREYRSQALHHCLFWKPSLSDPRDYVAWYDNQNARTSFKSIGGSARWGRFFEDVSACKIGKLIKNVSDVQQYVSSLRAYMSDPQSFPQGKRSF